MMYKTLTIHSIIDMNRESFIELPVESRTSETHEFNTQIYYRSKDVFKSHRTTLVWKKPAPVIMTACSLDKFKVKKVILLIKNLYTKVGGSDRMQQCRIASYSKIRILRAFLHTGNFEEIIKNYGLKLLNIFFVKKGLHTSFHILFLSNNENFKQNMKKTCFIRSFLVFTISFHQVFLATTDSRLGSSLTYTSVLIGWKLVFLNQSF